MIHETEDNEETFYNNFNYDDLEPEDFEDPYCFDSQNETIHYPYTNQN